MLYDVFDHLTSLSDPSGSWNLDIDTDGTLVKYTGTSTATVTYDPVGGPGIIVGVTTGSGTTRYLTGATPYARTINSTTQTQVADQLGTARGWIDPARTLAAVSDPNTWGAVTTPTAGDLGFAGGVTLPTGLVQFGVRQYDPTTGRFTTSDPSCTREAGETFGLYNYVTDDPLLSTDPTGMWIDMGPNAESIRWGLGNRTTGSQPSGASLSAYDFTKTALSLGRYAKSPHRSQPMDQERRQSD